MITVRKIITVTFRGISLLFLALVLYEAGRVVVAKQTVNEKFKTALTQKDGFVSLTDISKDYIDIFLQVEDPMFYAHKGIDFKTPGAGLTTVSQSLTKRLFFKQFKPGFAKLEQSLIARFVVHPTISKDDQLLAFFNIAYFGNCRGNPTYGFRPAARCYFGKEFKNLSEAEFVRLTAMLIGPNHYNPHGGSKELAKRAGRIENLLAGRCTPVENRDVYLKACPD